MVSLSSPTLPTLARWACQASSRRRRSSWSAASSRSISATRASLSSGVAVSTSDDVRLTFSISSSIARRSAASRAGGRDVTSLFSLAAASSTTSMALSGRNRDAT